MLITLSPRRMDALLALSKQGDVLTINEEAFDFSAIPEGATLPREAVDCAWLASDVERVNGQILLTLVLPHGERAEEATLFPDPITVDQDGEIILPAFEIAEEEPAP